MRITSKGQVTIPREVRERFGLLPHTEIEFLVEDNTVIIRKSAPPPGGGAPWWNGCAAGPRCG